MRGARFGDDLIDRDGLLSRLKIFLQTRFRVFQDAARVGFFQMGTIDSADKTAAGIEAGIQINRADDRFERIGEDRCAPPAAAFELAPAQYDFIGKPDLPADLGQLFSFYQGRPEPGQFALGGVREAPVEGIGDDKTEQGVTEVFQPFVIVIANAAMRQGPLKQAAVIERITGDLIYCGTLPVSSSTSSKSIIKYMFSNNLFSA